MWTNINDLQNLNYIFLYSRRRSTKVLNQVTQLNKIDTALHMKKLQ